MRNVTLQCDRCATRLPLEQAKEVLIKQGDNDYLLLDVCANCLDTLLKQAESVNDGEGFRQQRSALIALPSDMSLSAERTARTGG